MSKYTSIDRLIEHLEIQKSNFSTYQAAIGGTAADLTDITEAVTNLNYIRSYAEVFDQNKKTVFQNKSAMVYGTAGEPLAAWPASPAAVLPTPPGISGYGRESKARDERFKTGPGYNAEVATGMDIDTDTPAPPDPSTFKPTGEATAALTGFEFAVIVAGRGESDQWKVVGKTPDAATWSDLGFFTTKAGTIVYSGGTDEPVVLMLRIQLLRKGENYGQISDTFWVTVNP